MSEKNIRKVQKSHATYYLSVPIEIVRAMKLKEKQKVVFRYEKDKKRIIVKDWK